MATRLISSAVGIVILVAVFFLHDTIVLPLILAAVIGIILFELCRVVDGLRFRLAATAVLAYGISAPLLHFGAAAVEDGARALEAPMSVMEMIWLPLCLLALFLEFLWHHGDYKVEQLAFMGGAMYLVPWSLTKLQALNDLPRNGLFYLILALCGAWIADSGAYFTGVAIGKTKLCPKISPKKTVEGFIGGLASNAVVFAVLIAVFEKTGGGTVMPLDIVKAALLGVFCAAVSVVGDLTFSVIKREKGIKDYGKIMPGHGGLTDRFDSVLFVVPIFYYVGMTLSIF